MLSFTRRSARTTTRQDEGFPERSGKGERAAGEAAWGSAKRPLHAGVAKVVLAGARMGGMTVLGGIRHLDAINQNWDMAFHPKRSALRPGYEAGRAGPPPTSTAASRLTSLTRMPAKCSPRRGTRRRSVGHEVSGMDGVTTLSAG